MSKHSSQVGLVSLSSVISEPILVVQAAPPPPKTKPTYEEVEEAFREWEKLLWSGAKESEVLKAFARHEALANAFLSSD